MSRARLRFAIAGGRTRLLLQHVSYPFHITRPFHLDPMLPGLATLYLQSASGGLYGGDDLLLAIETAPGAQASVMTQAATMARNGRGRHAATRTRLRAGSASVLIYTPDPLVLFPKAMVASSLEVELAPDAIVICQDAFACHDPAAADGRFTALTSETVVRTLQGRVLLTDRSRIEGTMLHTPASPLGPYGASGTMLLLNAGLDNVSAIQATLDAAGCVAGISALPNSAGVAVRLLAPDGGRLSRGLALAFEACVRAALGAAPGPRRK